MTNERIKYFDLLKGCAIFLVVMGHVITMCIRDVDSAFIFKIISEVHMPIFFFISGYLSFKKGFLPPNLFKRAKQLLIPFVVVSALWIWYFPHSRLQSPISDNLVDMYTSYWKDGYWFTLCLFEIFIIYSAISRILSRTNNFIVQIGVILAVYCILIILSNYFSFPNENKDIIGLGLLTSFFPVFMMGVLAHRYKSQFETMIKGNYWFLIGIAAFIIPWYYVSYFWEFPMIPGWGILVARPIEHLGLAIVAITLIIPWSEQEFNAKNKPTAIARYFNYLGQESLSIYLLHYFFLFPLTPLQEPLRALGLSFVPLFTLAVCVSFIVIVFALFANYAIQRNRITSLLLTGK